MKGRRNERGGRVGWGEGGRTGGREGGGRKEEKVKLKIWEKK